MSIIYIPLEMTNDHRDNLKEFESHIKEDSLALNSIYGNTRELYFNKYFCFINCGKSRLLTLYNHNISSLFILTILKSYESYTS